MSSGGGRDTIWGGAGSDTFVFAKVSASRLDLRARDSIGDFERHDRVDLSAIDANSKASGDQTFRVVGEFTGQAGELEYSELPSSGNGTRYLVQADVNGDGQTDFALVLRTVASLPSIDDWAFKL